jgi:diguanylate cyclase (GGDEF)-like protein/PAS domain S-box-containing protein
MLSIPLDIRTLSVLAVVFALFFGVGLIAFSSAQRKLQGLARAGQGLITIGCGFLLLGLRHYIPAVLSVVVANTSILGGIVLANDGIRLFHGMARRPAPGLALVLANLLAFAYFTFITPSVSIRISIISLAFASASLLCLRSVLRGVRGKATVSQLFTAAGFVAFSGFMAFRSVWEHYQSPLQDFMHARTTDGLAILAVIFIVLVISSGMVWMANDAIQAELRNSERIIAATPDMVVLVDRQGIYKMVNEAVLRMLGVSREEVLGKSSAEMFGREFYEDVTRPCLEKALQGEACTVSRWLESPTLGPRFMALSYHPVPEADGSISLVAISTRDMTELQEVQEDRQRIFTMSLDMLCITDMEGAFKEVNPAWETTLGWDKDTLLRSHWLDFVHPDDIEATIDAGVALMKNQPLVKFVNRYRTKDGAYRFISWDSHPDPSSRLVYAVARDVSDRMEMQEKLKEQATHDPMTGAGNRRMFMQRAGEEIERSVRYGAPLSLLMLDVDHFKAINDTYGHDAGDEVLKALVVETRKQLRASDVFCRIGGEEFTAVLINADANTALALAERIRQALAGLTVASKESAITFTVSLGVTERAAGQDSVEAMLKRADNALYDAKENGRDQVRMA